MSKHNMNAGLPVAFRSYQAPANQMPDCAIWQALCATTAHPDLFKSIDIGDGSISESFVDGGLGCSNPLGHILAEAKAMYPDRHVGCVVSIGAGHVRTIHIPTFKLFQRLFPSRVIEVMKNIATDSERVGQEMAVRFNSTSDMYFRFNVDQGLQTVELSDWEQLNQVTAHTRAYLRHPEVSSAIDKSARAIKEKPRVIMTVHIGLYRKLPRMRVY
jgi:predicted acylesterase/phospholipase RssA